MDSQISNGRDTFLDNLRGLAILGVVAMHSMQLTDQLVSERSSFITNSVSYGRYGVEVFFFLSGWLLNSIYKVRKQRLPRSYFIRRAARIYPLWVIFLLVHIIWFVITDEGGFNLALNPEWPVADSLHQPIVVVLLTLSFGLFISASLWNTVMPGGWSIQAEVGHYLIFPLLRRFNMRSVLITAAFVNLISGVLYINLSHLTQIDWILKGLIDAWLRLGLYSTFSFFLIGILSFTFYHEITSKLEVTIPRKELLLFALSQLFIPCPQGYQIEAIGFLVIALLTATLVTNMGVLSRLASSLGRFSYFIYFVHFLLLDVIKIIAVNREFKFHFYGSQIFLFLIILFIVLVLSQLFAIPSMRFIENPIIRRARRFKS
jgi:peptidoglycan/LPS O-acetylase OafA/YrhL